MIRLRLAQTDVPPAFVETTAGQSPLRALALLHRLCVFRWTMAHRSRLGEPRLPGRDLHLLPRTPSLRTLIREGVRDAHESQTAACSFGWTQLCVQTSWSLCKTTTFSFPPAASLLEALEADGPVRVYAAGFRC